MSQISAEKFVIGVKTICDKKPKYKAGHDGSTQYCDAIGLVRGGLLRSGATKVKSMKEINQCARTVLKDIKLINDDLIVGDIVLKISDNDDSFMPLSAKYKLGGNEYSEDMNNYTDIGVVTRIAPLEIVHMTKKGIRKDKNAKNWDCRGWLPYITEERQNDCMTKVVFAPNDSSVKAYQKPTFASDGIELANGAFVNVLDDDGHWSVIEYQGEQFYILSKFLAEPVIEEEKIEEKPQITEHDIEELRAIYKTLGTILQKFDGKPKKRRWFR